ncbi:MAG: TIGR03013 family PEP-CTERM/XrtA system glycosyltransferase [Gammaproteobacteria bacterium]|nr:TIGR03013 family PEP-CTERM/XrtA system glycosyltransferase [Gammaproteobacteria bacterium]
MIRLFRHYVPLQLLLLGLVEGGLLFAAIYLGAALRFEPHELHQIHPIWPKALIFTSVMLSCMTAVGLYIRETPKGNWSYYAKFVASFLLGWVAMTVIFYVHPGFFLGRGVFGIAFVLGLGSTALARAIFFRVVDQQALQRRVLVLGAGTRAAAVGKLLKENPSGHKFHLVGYLPLKTNEHHVDKSKILQDQGTLLSLAYKYSVDEIVVGVRDRRNGGIPMSELLECKMEGVMVTDLPTFFERETGHVQIDCLNPSWIVFSDGFEHGSYKYIIKRIFDVVVSLLLLVITLPIMLLTALLIYMESGLPIFYRQERVGEFGRTFKILKFRSMRQDAERGGTPQWAKKNDDRVTRVGRIIRLLRIDELPQIFNVLNGDMSFVGPRPERPFFVQDLTKQIPYYLNRHAVKPGITGWAQIRYPYGASVEDAVKKLQYDLYYAKNHSLFLDIIILFQTVQVILLGKGAR